MKRRALIPNVDNLEGRLLMSTVKETYGAVSGGAILVGVPPVITVGDPTTPGEPPTD